MNTNIISSFSKSSTELRYSSSTQLDGFSWCHVREENVTLLILDIIVLLLNKNVESNFGCQFLRLDGRKNCLGERDAQSPTHLEASFQQQKTNAPAACDRCHRQTRGDQAVINSKSRKGKNNSAFFRGKITIVHTFRIHQPAY
jgi:hypothetical protein